MTSSIKITILGFKFVVNTFLLAFIALVKIIVYIVVILHFITSYVNIYIVYNKYYSERLILFSLPSKVKLVNLETPMSPIQAPYTNIGETAP